MRRTSDARVVSRRTRSGNLIQLFDIVGNDGHAYWMVYPEARRNVPKIRAFRDWMLAEIGALTGEV